MKFIVVDGGNASINADTVTKIEKYIEAEHKGSIFAHVKGSEEMFLVGQYEGKGALEKAFTELMRFLKDDDNGVFDCPNTKILSVTFHEAEYFNYNYRPL